MEKGSSSSSSESLNGLSFGKKIYFEGAGSGYGARSPAKRGRNGVVHGGQPPRCQVEGCKVDLSDTKAYYCRHKVCGMHSKSPKVIVAGIEQRFCQQCSRFHQLGEFDQGKRSCRRRLAGHNERRRKPPPGPISLSSSRTGALVMDFTTYPNNAAQYWHNPQPHLLPPYNGAGVQSSSALSLLSNQLWGTNHFHQNNIDASQSTNPDASQFSWGFKGDKIGNDLHEMPSDAQISVSGNEDLGLGQPSSTDYHELVEHPSDYDSSVHWSL